MLFVIITCLVYIYTYISEFWVDSPVVRMAFAQLYN